MRGTAANEETVKWGHLVYAANGPALLIRARGWRGSRLLARPAAREIEPRLKPGGKYEMATFAAFREGVTIKPAVVTRLARQAVALNKKVGDPAKAWRGSDEEGRCANEGTGVNAAQAIQNRTSTIAWSSARALNLHLVRQSLTDVRFTPEKSRTSAADICSPFISASCRLCCKSRSAPVIKNSAGHRRGFRVKM